MLTQILELRRRLIITVSSFAGLFLLAFYFANPLFSFVISPLLNSLPQHQGLIATAITSPLITPIKLAANIALICTAPIALMQAWRFIVPALYHHERQPLSKAIFTSIALFCLGVLFCFYLVLPFMFQFISKALPSGVHMMPDISNALDFITNMLLIFGLFFQVPLICLLMVLWQWIELQTLIVMRPYVIVLAFILGMLLTPPDVLSQIMLALPLCLLYELGILLARWGGQRALRTSRTA